MEFWVYFRYLDIYYPQIGIQLRDVGKGAATPPRKWSGSATPEDEHTKPSFCCLIGRLGGSKVLRTELPDEACVH